MRTSSFLAAVAAGPALFCPSQTLADDVAELPAPTETFNALGALASFHNRNDGFGTNSDLLDVTFLIDIDFTEKLSGTRENIFETGGGTVGSSFVYEAPNALVARTVGNGGVSLLTVSYALPQSVVDDGDAEVGFTFDADDGTGLQELAIIVNAVRVASATLGTGGDWSGSGGAKFGTGGGVTGSGANGTITSIAFGSGTINTTTGLRYYPNSRWVPVASDSDADGLPDWWEEIFAPGDLSELASGEDADGDGLDDEIEFGLGTNPIEADTDGDELSDGVEAGSANPGFTDTDPLLADTDGDGRSDGEEVNGPPVTDPLERDSDTDGVNDGVEVAAGTDPNDPSNLPDLGGFLVAHYALDSLGAGSEAVDPFGFYHLQGTNLTPASVVDGMDGGAVSFDAANRTMLSRLNLSGDGLPISQHTDHTIAMWVKVAGAGQNDLRLFSEASTSENQTLYNLGTHNGGTNGSLDVYLRNADASTTGHQLSGEQPFDGTWHHIAWVRSGDSATLFVDGAFDSTAFAWLDPFSTTLHTTSLGGILRGVSSHWVTGAIDDVSLWSAALSPASVAALAAGGDATGIIDDSDSDGLPDVWESKFGLDPGAAADAALDGDGDTLSNFQEYALGTNPTESDTDGDTLADNVETDDGVWVSALATGTSPRSADTDRDGLPDNIENPEIAFDPENPTVQPGSDPLVFDTDGDGVSDGSEANANANPTNPNASPEALASGIWCADDEPLGTGYGGDGWPMNNADAPAGAVLNPQNDPEVIDISARGAAQTGLAQTVDFVGTAKFNIAAAPDALRELYTAGGVEIDGSLEFTLSPDSLSGGNQYVWESGGTGDGQGIVLIDGLLYLGVNDANGAPYGNAVTDGIELAALYAGGVFNPDDYLLVRAVFETGKIASLGVTHLGTGATASNSTAWHGNSWDGGDVLGFGGTNGGRGGDRNNQLSSLPGASTTWSSFDGQIAKFSYYQVPLAPTANIITDRFEITAITFDSGSDEFTLTWNSEPGITYGLFASEDGSDWSFELDDSILATSETASYTFPHPSPDAGVLLFRIEKSE